MFLFRIKNVASSAVTNILRQKYKVERKSFSRSVPFYAYLPIARSHKMQDF